MTQYIGLSRKMSIVKRRSSNDVLTLRTLIRIHWNLIERNAREKLGLKTKTGTKIRRQIVE
jgi:hypothetical protein